jgi:hypothetical protein
MGSFSFDELLPSVLPYGTMCWLIESKFILSPTNKLLFSIGLFTTIGKDISNRCKNLNSMTELEFEQNICVFYPVDHVGEVHVLDLHDVALHP